MNEQRTAEEVVVEAQKIAALVQLGTFLKATQLGAAKETGTQLLLQVNDRQQTRIFLNSKLVEEALTAEFNKLGQELTDAGVDLDALMKAEHERFQLTYLST